MTAPDDIPTEALEAAREAVARHRNPELRGIGPQRDIVVMPEEYAECVALADTAITSAAPHLIAEGRQQAAAEIRASIRTVTSDLLPITEPNRWWAGGMQQAAQIAEGSTND